MTSTEPIDVWLKWEDSQIDPSDVDPLATYEANTFIDGGEFRVDWYHNDVGLVHSVYFKKYSDAVKWLTHFEFQDFTT